MRHNKHHPAAILMEIRPSSSPNIHIEFELFPEDQLSDYRLHLTIQPLRFTYDTVSRNQTIDLFDQR